MWSRLDHYWSNVYQRDHRSGCLLKRFIVIENNKRWRFELQTDRWCPVSRSGKNERSSPPTVSIERVSNSTVPPSASAILSGGARSLSLKFKHVVKPSSTRSMAERKGQVYADKWAALLQLRWVLEASERYPGNHGIYGSADRNLERIRQLFGNLLSFAWKWSVDLLASLYFFYSGRYLL